MSKYLYGFVGCGNMGGALAAAACKTGAQRVLLANRTAAKADALAARLGCASAGSDNCAVAKDSKFIFLGCKPYQAAEVLEQLSGALAENPEGVLVSMLAGTSVAVLRQLAGPDRGILRIMPNTPAAIGQGMIQYAADGVSEADLALFLEGMKEAGLWDALPENLIDAASCVSGCGPAWVYQMIEALSDGGVACGLPRAKALQYAAQMVSGAAQMVLESGQHPGALKDAVCSPGGSTIQGVRALEQRGFRGAVTDAVIAAYDRTKEMGKH